MSASIGPANTKSSSQARDAAIRSGGQSRGGAGGGSSTRSGGRGGFGGARPDTPENAERSARFVLYRFDINKDGEIDVAERERMGQLFDSMGLDSSQKVTLETLAKAIQARPERSTRQTPVESKDTDARQKDSGDKD